MADKREELVSGNIFKLMLKLGVPGIIGMLVISLYSFVDAMFVGRYVGEKALGAISVAYAFTLVNNGIAVLRYWSGLVPHRFYRVQSAEKTKKPSMR